MVQQTIEKIRKYKMNNFKLFYQHFRDFHIFKNLSDFEIIFWVFLIIFYLHRKYYNYVRQSKSRTRK